jgi:hypothetical protein
MLAAMADNCSQDLTIYAALFLQGVFCAKFAQYANLNKRDSVWLKLFVAGLALLTMLKTPQVSYAFFSQLQNLASSLALLEL